MPRRLRHLTIAAVVVILVASLAALAWDRWTRPVEQPHVRDGYEEFLAPWYDAVRNHEQDPATVVVVGDSISEGVLLSPPVYPQRFVHLLQESLRESVEAEGGEGYMPAYYGDAVTSDDTERSGPPAQELMFQGWGLGGRALSMPARSTVTYPEQAATRVRVWYGRTPVLGGEATVLVDGEDVTDQGELSNGDESGPVLSSLAASDTSALAWTSPELDPGPHVVQVRSTRPGLSFLHTGVEFLDGDEESGVRVVDASHSGATASDFVTVKAVQGHWREVAAREPDLVVVNIGTNPEPDYRASLELLVDNALAAAPGARILLVHGYEPGSWTTEGWEEVREVREAVAAERSDRVKVFDLSAHWPVLAKDGSTNDGLMVEETRPVHLTAEGNERMAEIFTELLTPPAQ